MDLVTFGWDIRHLQSFQKNFTSTDKKNLTKNLTSKNYYFIKDNIKVTLLINGKNLAKSKTTFPPCLSRRLNHKVISF